MNVLHTETLQGWGGQQNKVIKELVATRDLGHAVFLLCGPGTEIGARARNAGVTVFEFPMTRWTYHKSIPFTLQLIEKLNIDVLITHSSADSWMGAIAGRLARRKVIAMRERHNLHTIVGWPSKWLHRKLFHRLLAVSQKVKDYLVEEIQVQAEKVLLLNSVVNVAAFEHAQSTIRQELGIPADALVIGMFSILRVNKGIYDFREIVARMLPANPNTYAIFGGKTNPDRIREFSEYFRQHGVDPGHVKWTGYREDAANVMKGFDVFVFPSHSEGWPNVLLEAMACGLPVVTYDIRPMSDMIENGATGFTVPFQDFDLLAQRTGQLLRDAGLRRELGRAALAAAKQRFDEAGLKENVRGILEAVTRG